MLYKGTFLGHGAEMGRMPLANQSGPKQHEFTRNDAGHKRTSLKEGTLQE